MTTDKWNTSDLARQEYYVRRLTHTLSYLATYVRGGVAYADIDRVLNETKHLSRAKYFTEKEKSAIHKARELIRTYRNDDSVETELREEGENAFRRALWDAESELEFVTGIH